MLLSRIDRALSGTPKGERTRAAAADQGGVTNEGAAGVIGERFESIQGGLDQLADMARQFGTFETLLKQVRDPLDAEFRARRDGHVELINLRAAHGEASQRAESLTAEARRLADALAESEARADDLAARHGEQTANLQEARVETDRLRSELSQAVARVAALETADRASAARISELEQDQDGLRAQLKQAESKRAEAEAGRSQSQRDHALVLEENTVLRRRMEEIGVEIAALERSSATNEGQLATERARASSEQAEATRALRALENLVETGRAEIAALSARLDTVTARANGLEVLNSEQASRLNELQSSAHAADRRGEALQVTQDRALERVRSLEAEAEEARQRHAAMDVARLAAVDRAEALTKAAAAHDKAIARAEERMVKIQTKLATVQDEHQARVQGLTDQITALRAELEGARAEAAMSTAALDAARRERTGRPAAVETSGSVQAIVG